MKSIYRIPFTGILLVIFITAALGVSNGLASPVQVKSLASEVVLNPADIELIGHLEGSFYDVKVQGNYAFVQDTSPSPICFRVIDIADPANPVEIGAFSLPNCSEFDLWDSYVYVSAMPTVQGHVQLHVVDISDPADPVEVGSSIEELQLGQDPARLAVYYPYVYWGIWSHDAHGSRGDLYIINVADPTNPTLVKSLITGYVSEIAFQGTYAYLTGSGFMVLDVSDPKDPTFVSNGSLDYAASMVLTEGYAYITGDSHAEGIYDALFIEDIRDPYHLSRVNVLPNYHGIVGREEDILYVLDWRNNQLHALNISDPVLPVEVGSYDTSGTTSNFFVDGNMIYVPGYASGLSILRLYGTIRGQVTDANRIPYLGVKLETSGGISTTVDANGFYTFSNLLPDIYTITPTLPGYAFSPPHQDAVVPSLRALDLDFYILPTPVSIALTPGITSFLTLTDTQGLTSTLTFPAGAITETLTLALTPTVSTEVGLWAFAGLAFSLAIERGGPPVAGYQFPSPVVVRIHYSDEDIRLVTEENKLALWQSTTSGWQDAVLSCEGSPGYIRQPDENVLTLPICQTGAFKLVGPSSPLFLPAVFSGP